MKRKSNEIEGRNGCIGTKIAPLNTLTSTVLSQKRNISISMPYFIKKKWRLQGKMAKITVECESRSTAERLDAAEKILRAFLKYLVRITPDEQKLRRTYQILREGSGKNGRQY